MNNEPVAWWTGKFEDEGEDFMFPDTRQSHIDHPQSETHTFFPIPLYTHPVKEQDESFDRTASHMAGEYVSYKAELTDEEIAEIAGKTDIFDPKWIYVFARAILLKAQEK